MHRKQSGFTIVELVVVIILLGILAATALPRFIDIDDDAHAAAFEAVMGSLQTGVSMFKAKAVATDTGADQVPTPDEFSGLRATVGGYPYGTSDNSGAAPPSTVATATNCVEVFQNVQQGGSPTIATTTDINTVAADGAGLDYVAEVTGTQTCVFYYTGETTVSGDTIRTMTYDPASGGVVAGTATLP